MSHDTKNDSTFVLMQQIEKLNQALNNLNYWMKNPSCTNDLAKKAQLEFNEIVQDLLFNMHTLNVKILKDHESIMPPVQSANFIDYTI